MCCDHFINGRKASEEILEMEVSFRPSGAGWSSIPTLIKLGSEIAIFDNGMAMSK